MVVDDEPDSIHLLTYLIGQHFPQLELIAAHTEPEQALHAIRQLQPQVLFLDIQMPNFNGLDLLQKINPNTPCKVIFVTAFDEYALRALNMGAFHYLCKPLQLEELRQAVSRLSDYPLLPSGDSSELKGIVPHVSTTSPEAAPPRPEKIAIFHRGEHHLIPIQSVEWLEADGNYTTFHTDEGKPYVHCRALGEIEEALIDYGFLRIHRQYMIRLNAAVKMSRGESSAITLKSGTTLPVSRHRRVELEERFLGF